MTNIFLANHSNYMHLNLFLRIIQCPDPLVIFKQTTIHLSYHAQNLISTLELTSFFLPFSFQLTPHTSNRSSHAHEETQIVYTLERGMIYKDYSYTGRVLGLPHVFHFPSFYRIGHATGKFLFE